MDARRESERNNRIRITPSGERCPWWVHVLNRNRHLNRPAVSEAVRCEGLLRANQKDLADSLRSPRGPAVQHVSKTAMHPGLARGVVMLGADRLVVHVRIVSAEASHFFDGAPHRIPPMRVGATIAPNIITRPFFASVRDAQPLPSPESAAGSHRRRAAGRNRQVARVTSSGSGSASHCAGSTPAD